MCVYDVLINTTLELPLVAFFILYTVQLYAFFFKGFPKPILKIFSKYNYGVSKCITEGIHVCLPVNVRVDLTRNITSRSR